MASYKDLKVWQKAHALAVQVYKISSRFPRYELFGITSQLRRAVTSVPANIAEGQSRRHREEFIQFLYIAKGSLAETDYFLTLCKDLGYIKTEEYQQLAEETVEVLKLLNALTSSVACKAARKKLFNQQLTTNNC